MLERSRQQIFNSPHTLSREDLAAYFDMPIKAAAKEIGICTTILKKLCRKNGIPRWPHRKVRGFKQNRKMLTFADSKPEQGDYRIRSRRW